MKLKKLTNIVKENCWNLTILLIISQLLGYSYNISILSYFNIDKSFYELNVFGDYIDLFLVSLLFLTILAEASLITYIIHSIIMNYNRYKLWKEKLKFIILTLFITSIIFIFLYIFNINFMRLYDIDSSTAFYLLLGCTLLVVVSFLIFNIFKKLASKIYVGDYYDKILTIIMILVSITILFKSAMNLGNNVAANQSTFMFLDDTYIVLYNTSEYAIVTDKYEINEENTIKIYTEKVQKIEITNYPISFKTFKKVKVI